MERTEPPPTHPGLLLQRFLAAQPGMTAQALAARLGLSNVALHYILHGRNRITAATALRLAAMFGVPAHRWLELQDRFEIAKAEIALARELNAIQPYSGSELNLDSLFEHLPDASA